MPTSRQRRAISRPSGAASRRSPSYLRAWRHARAGPPYDAHHSSCTSPGGVEDGRPMGIAAGSPRRRPMPRSQFEQGAAPSLPQAGQMAGNSMSMNRCKVGPE